MAKSPTTTLAPLALLLVLTAVPALAEDAGSTAPTAGNASSPARAAFERFKALAGEWRGKSGRGWTDRASFQVLGGDSAVLSTSSFDGPEAKPMATVFHLDGDRLLLTHYCMAGNQPRLQATEISPDGREVTFTFVDATNLASRDVGHMDKAVYRFVDENHYTTVWTWYQDGKERWLEEIEAERNAPE